jgi:uncharacterized protein YacL
MDKKDRNTYSFYQMVNTIGIIIGLIVVFIGVTYCSGTAKWIVEVVGVAFVVIFGLLAHNLSTQKTAIENGEIGKDNEEEEEESFEASDEENIEEEVSSDEDKATITSLIDEK